MFLAEKKKYEEPNLRITIYGKRDIICGSEPDVNEGDLGDLNITPNPEEMGTLP